MKNYDKNIKYWDVNNFYGWAILQMFPAGDSKSVEETSQFNEDFIKSYNDDSNEGYFIEVDLQ